MTPRADILKDVVADLRIAASFVMIVPVASPKPSGEGTIARATWALPVAGLLVGLAGALVYKVAIRVGLTPNLGALLALATTTLITGALHEDGLADTADGLGGGRTRERKLEIMRDSRIGSYGVCALILSFGLRWSALAAIENPSAAALALCVTHSAARAGVPAFMALVAPARADGLSASAGAPPGRSVAIAFALGVLSLAFGLGPAKAIVGVILLSLAGLILARLAIRQIGGQTGDILGAFEQVAEILILLVAASFQMGH
jgi:adenosylcobinamide-GDP ribazoletransferase